MKLRKSWALALTSAFVLAACNDAGKGATTKEAQKEQKSFKLGVMSGPEQTVFEKAAEIAKERYGVDVQFVVFNDYALPNKALEDGEIDANAFQHQPYLEKEEKEKGYKNIQPVGNTFVFPLAGYSKKIKSLAQLKKGATISLPNDPANLGRSLILLEKQGLIKLKDNKNLYATPEDVISNPKNIKFRLVDSALSAKTLDDVDIAIINNTFASQAGLNAKENSVFVEDKDSPYVNFVASRKDNANNQAILDFVKAVQTPEVLAEAKKEFGDAVAKGW